MRPTHKRTTSTIATSFITLPPSSPDVLKDGEGSDDEFIDVF
jgi:hypothetical protein